MRLHKGWLLPIALLGGCSLIADFDPNRAEGGPGGNGGVGGGSGSGGSGGSAGRDGGPPDGPRPDGPPPDAQPPDGPPMQCLHNTDCSDGNFCTFNVCDNGTCTFPPRNCDDTIACTVDGCDPASGCTHTPDDTQCNDFLDCTNDLCDPTFGCDHQPVDSRCVDGILCTVDFCDLQQGCVHQPSDARCDDGNPCTTDRCDPTSGSSDGCVHLPIPNCVTCSSPGFPCARQCVPCAPVSFVQPCDFVCSDQGVCVQTQTCGPCSLNCQP